MPSTLRSSYLCCKHYNNFTIASTRFCPFKTIFVLFLLYAVCVPDCSYDCVTVRVPGSSEEGTGVLRARGEDDCELRLETKAGSPAQTGSSFNHWSTSPVPVPFLFKCIRV